MFLLLLACSHPDPSAVDTHGGGVDSCSCPDTADTADTAYTALQDDPYITPAVWLSPSSPVPGETATVYYAGPMADHDQLRIHYGFNGWNQAELDGMTQTGGGGNTSWYVETDMARVDDSTYSATITLAQDARAIHMAFVDTVTDEWDNNGGQDYVWAVAFPFIGPYLTLGQDQVVVNFETAVSCLGTLEYGADADHLDHALRGQTTDTFHHITIPDLVPGQQVAYRVLDSQGRASDVASFTWRNADPFAFVALSDMQDNGEVQRWAEVAQVVLAEHSDAAFLLAPGDLTNSDEASMWWTFFDKGRGLFSTIPLFAAPGNHDTPGGASSDDLDSYIRYFDPPLLSDGSPFQALTFGGSSFFSLTSETSLLSDSAQYAAMSAALDAEPEGTLFAFWHIPPYDAGERHYTQQQETRPLTALFDGRVDMVINGHEHLYQRFVPITYEATAADHYGRDGGVMYVVLPPAGNFNEDHLAPVDAEEAVSRDLLAYPAAADIVDSEIGFLRVELSGTQTTVHAYGLGPLHEPADLHEVDSVSWER